MPPKKTRKTSSVKSPWAICSPSKSLPAVETEKHVCPICVMPIVDEGEDGCIQDALFCEGECQCWLHRWCASVTRERYAVLSSTEDAFLCPSCTVARQQAAIASQQEDITRLRECVSSLTDELRGLKATVATMQSRSLPLKGQANTSNALPWCEEGQ